MNINNQSSHKRWTIRELINTLEQLSDDGSNDDLPVIIDNPAEDYLYDIGQIKIETYISEKDTRHPFVSLKCYDNIVPIDLSKDIED